VVTTTYDENAVSIGQSVVQVCDPALVVTDTITGLSAADGCDSISITFYEFTLPDIQNQTIVLCAGDEFMNQIWTTNGTIGDTLQDQNGCDSIVSNFDISVLSTTVLQDTVVICPGESFLGIPWASSTQVNQQLPYSNLATCDSVLVQWWVEVLQTITLVADTTLCTGDFFLGQTWTNAGTASETILSQTGCDSLIINWNVSLQQTAITTTDTILCTGESLFGTQWFTDSSYVDSIFDATGCLIEQNFVNITVINPVNMVDTIIVCDPADAGVDTVSTTNTFGCVYNEITVRIAAPSPDFIIMDSIVCDIALNALQIQDTILSQYGCDSLISITSLQYVPPDTVFLLQATCIVANADTTSTVLPPTINFPCGQVQVIYMPYDENSVSIGQSIVEVCDPALVGVDTITGLNAMDGCDSISIISYVFWDPTFITMDDVIVCDEALQGTVSDTLLSIAGCDSIITSTTYVYEPPMTSSFTHFICPGEEFMGIPIFGDTVLVDTVFSGNSCILFFLFDSIFLIEPVVMVSDTVVCSGSELFGAFPMQDTSFVFPLGSGGACDSLLTVNVIVQPVYQIDSTLQICAGAEVLGIPVFQDTIFSLQLQTTTGCDSVVNIQVQVATADNLTEQVSVCEGDSLFGEVWLSDSIFVDSTFTADSCLSAITTYSIQVLNPFTQIDTAFTCSPAEVGLVLVDSIVNAAGCVSYFYLENLLLPTYDDTIFATVDAGMSFDFGGQLLDISGVYVDSNFTASGCDSIVTLLLEVISPPAAVTFHFGNASGYPGEIVAVDVTVSNFENVQSIQFPVSWDPSIMSFVEVSVHQYIEQSGSSRGAFYPQLLSNANVTTRWQRTFHHVFSAFRP
jgi:hypothetical protein